jgi:hypothetical protein
MTDNPQIPKDFCFSCPSLNLNINQKPGIIKRKLLNPWPMLAANPSLCIPRVDPLTRMVYVYTYSPRPFASIKAVQMKMVKRLEANNAQSTEMNGSDLNTWIIWLHEYTHLFVLDWTPAKEVARLFLALSYAAIGALSCMAPSPSSLEEAKKIWELFLVHSDCLSQLSAMVSFVEELFATAFTFDGLEEQARPGGMWAGLHDELSNLKEQCVSDQEEKLPGFRAMYKNEEFQLFIRMIKDNLTFGAYVIPMPQPVEYENGKLCPKDSYTCLNTVLTLINGAENAQVAMQRLQPLEQQVNQGWQAALGMQLDWARMPLQAPGWYIRQLWKISRCKIDEEVVMDAGFNKQQLVPLIEEYCIKRRLMFQDPWAGPGDSIFLHPSSSIKGDFITGVIVPDQHHAEVPVDVQAAFRIVSSMEALREQLRTQEGIFCPEVAYQTSANPQVCYCTREGRSRLEGLYRLAKELFVHEEFSGSWSELFCKDCKI